MKNKKQVKLGSLVRLTGKLAIDFCDGALYGVVCGSGHGSRPHSKAIEAYRNIPVGNFMIHLQDGTKYWAYVDEFEVLA